MVCLARRERYSRFQHGNGDIQGIAALVEDRLFAISQATDGIVAPIVSAGDDVCLGLRHGCRQAQLGQAGEEKGVLHLEGIGLVLAVLLGWELS
jgi:hypothetical protein